MVGSSTLAWGLSPETGNHQLALHLRKAGLEDQKPSSSLSDNSDTPVQYALRQTVLVVASGPEDRTQKANYNESRFSELVANPYEGGKTS